MRRRTGRIERPGGLADGGRRKRRIVPAALRGKPLRRIQREIEQRVLRFPHRNLLVTALPKSGSTWVENMLLELPGHHRWYPRSFNRQSIKDPAFHELSLEEMRRLPPGYSVTKVHSGPSENNVRVLESLGRPYVVLLRDLRDVVVSWAHFIAIRPENALHDETKGMDAAARVMHCIRYLMPRYADWAALWAQRRSPTLSRLVRYEDLLRDAESEMAAVFAHFGAPLPAERVRRIVRKHAFSHVTGREPGQEDASDFYRKGVAGDWRNHFSHAHKREFKARAGATLIALGYETGEDW